MTTTTETELLRAEIQGLAPTKQLRRYPAELQERVTAYARRRLEGGCSVPSVCEELDVGEPTLRKFLGLATAGEKSAGFNRVRTAKPGRQEAEPRAVIRTTSGVVVEGLSVADIAELLRRLGCSA